ncbi:MAG: hypothetical protein J3Q66DRAFT_375303 [Benniella sp.]|nr:MAG: hypothetical protein J3Q66DRAFT_375303 [Benniella sp.]
MKVTSIFLTLSAAVAVLAQDPIKDVSGHLGPVDDSLLTSHGSSVETIPIFKRLSKEGFGDVDLKLKKHLGNVNNIDDIVSAFKAVDDNLAKLPESSQKAIRKTIKEVMKGQAERLMLKYGAQQKDLCLRSTNLTCRGRVPLTDVPLCRRRKPVGSQHRGCKIIGGMERSLVDREDSAPQFLPLLSRNDIQDLISLGDRRQPRSYCKHPFNAECDIIAVDICADFRSS